MTCVILTSGCAPNTAIASPVNIALGKTYRLSPPPNYHLCTDAGDTIQLTDGVKNGSDWQRKSTVGWRTKYSFPRIRIDLGAVHPIGGIRIHTASGAAASVFLPEQILVMVSDDGRSFGVACTFDDVALNETLSPVGRRAPDTFSRSNLKATGRFVEIIIIPHGKFVFLDEIEVFLASDETQNEPIHPVIDYTDGNITSLIVEHRETIQIRESIGEFSKKVSLSVPNTKDEFTDTVDALVERSRELGVLELGERQVLAKDFASLRGEWLHASTGRRIIWRQADPSVQSHPDDVYWFDGNVTERLSLSLWEREYESAAVTIVNCSPSAATASVSLSPLKASKEQERPSSETITLRYAVNVDALGKGQVGDALPLLSNNRLNIPAGAAAQIWLSVHNPSLPAGEYKFAISVTASFKEALPPDRITIQGKITIHPIRFPDEASLLTMTYSYLRRYKFPNRVLDSVIDDLKRHYMNVYVIPIEDHPSTKLMRSGKLEINFARHDSAIQTYPDAKQYFFFWGNVQSTPTKRGYRHAWADWMSPKWKAAMRQYIVTWVEHLRQMGIGYDRFAMYPYDETLCLEFSQLAAFIKEIDPNIRIFANSAGKKHSSELERIAPYVDVWCLPENRSGSAIARKKLAAYTPEAIWRYDCQGNAKSLSPLTYYRQQPWRAWATGDTGCAFWTHFGRPHTTTRLGWNDVQNRRAQWDTVYSAKDARVNCSNEYLVPSRRWEAWREGIEDYEYLVTLQNLILKTESAGDASSALQSQRVLDNAVRDVLGNKADTHSIYRAREMITEQILRLTSQRDPMQSRNN